MRRSTAEPPNQQLRQVDLLILAALAVAGLVVTLRAPTLFLGVRVLLGSCASLIAFLLYRSYWGVAVAIPSSLATIWMFGDPLTAIRLIGEIATISWINRKPQCDRTIRSGRIIRHIAIYAIVIGCPFLYFSEIHLLGTQPDIAQTLAYKNFINSIFNVLVAYAVYSWIELQRNQRVDGSRHQISMRTLTSVILILTCIILSYSLIKRESAIAAERAQLMIIQRNHSLASMIQRVQLVKPIQEIDDLASIFVDSEENADPETDKARTGLRNEYTIALKRNKLVLVKPDGETDVWFSLRIKDQDTPIQHTTTFFKQVLPTLVDYRHERIISPPLSIRTPGTGSKLDRLLAGYWIYTNPDHDYSEPREIVIATPLRRFITTVSASSNAGLKILAEVVLIALFVSNLIASKLTHEWSAIIPKKATGDDFINAEEPYKQSPITEISTSVENINARTSIIIAAKKQIEYLNAITQRQLSTAAEIQSYFLAKNFPQTCSYDVTGLTRPAYDVGGDWYDAFTIKHHSFFIVADVCDKGVGSALFMSVFRTLIRYSTRFYFRNDSLQNPSQAMVDVMGDVNHYMSTNHGNCMYFATVFFGHLEESIPRLNYVSAGHEAALLRRRDGSHLHLERTGPALGIFDAASFSSASVDFPAGDLLLAHSDGVTDAINPEEKRYGTERLERFLDSHYEETVEQMQTDLLAELDAFMRGSDQFDDITMMFIKRKG